MAQRKSAFRRKSSVSSVSARPRQSDSSSKRSQSRNAESFSKRSQPRNVESLSRRGQPGIAERAPRPGQNRKPGRKRPAVFSRKPNSKVSSRKKSGSATTSRQRSGQNLFASQNREVVSAGLEARRQERAQARRRSRIVYTAIALAVVVILGALVWLFAFSSVLAFQTKNTRVMGTNDAVSGQDVQTLMSRYDGTPLLRLPTKQIENELKNSSNWVKDATVTRELPHGAAVHLTMREVVGQNQDGQLIALDGVLLTAPTKGGLDKVQYPLINQSCKKELVTDCLAEGATVAKSLDKDLRKTLSAVEVTRHHNVELQLNQETRIIWGEPEHNQKKLEVAKLLLQQRGGQQIDVSDYAHPVVGPKADEQAS